MVGEHQSFWRPRTVVQAVEQGMLCGRLFVCRKPIRKLLLDLRVLLFAPLFALSCLLLSACASRRASFSSRQPTAFVW